MRIDRMDMQIAKAQGQRAAAGVIACSRRNTT
jgi:hypothetical protein